MVLSREHVTCPIFLACAGEMSPTSLVHNSTLSIHNPPERERERKRRKHRERKEEKNPNPPNAKPFLSRFLAEENYSEMTQPSVPTPPPPLPPPPPPSDIRVRCAGCRMILAVAPGLTEFACPTCRMPQMLPPELMPPRADQTATATTTSPLPAPPASSAPAHGIDPTKIQLPCANCKALLNVPHGLSHFSCPQCEVNLAVDLSKVKQFLPSAPPPEEVNEVRFLHSNHAFSVLWFLSVCFSLDF